MGIFFENYTMGSILALIGFIIIYLVINEVTRKSKILSILVYGALPVVLGILIFTGVLDSPSSKTWFGWVKVISALIGIYGFMLIRFTKLGENKFAMIFPVAILAINISEAVYKEIEIFMQYKTITVDSAGLVVLGGPWNIMNAIAGILCIVTLTGFVGVKASRDKSKDMIWPDMTWVYIMGYTIWNMAYVYNGVSTRAMYAGIAILLAALIAEFVFKRGAWLQHRAQILALYAMFTLSFDFQQSELFQIVPVYKESMWMILSVISLLFNVGVFIYMIYTILKYKKNPLKEEIYTHTNYYKKTIKDNNL
ncbi:DUF5692 family protein [uncultured Clostridium sp.]|uniref:DUF5692 family protein n=1 Tax=uncultured Clostridium sp. TaxID=59620 RepID=UPI002606881C|nr:DUF5692 family protein [uncultured Clostridium sp.]